MKSDAPQSTNSKALFGESDDSDWEDLGGGKFVADSELVFIVTKISNFSLVFFSKETEINKKCEHSKSLLILDVQLSL